MLAGFHRDEKCAWRVKSAYLYHKDKEEEEGEEDQDTTYTTDAPNEIPIRLTKDEKEDASLLGKKLQELLTPSLQLGDKVIWMRDHK